MTLSLPSAGRVALFGAALAFLPLSAWAVDGYPIISSYLASDVGLDDRSLAITQDATGRMQFGTRGLVTFDGDRWDHTPAGGSYALRGLEYGADGKLWAGAGGEIGWFEPASNGMRFHSLIGFLPKEHREVGEVFQAMAEGDGAVFFTHDKILRWDGQEFRIWPLPKSRRLRASRADGTIFVQHKPSGLLILGENGPEGFIPVEHLGNAGVFWLERRGTGWLLITHEGILEWSSGEMHPIAPDTDAIIQRASLTCVVDIGNGKLALGTGREGIIIINHDGTLLQQIGEREGLPGSIISDLYLDREEQLWGISRSHLFNIRLSSNSTVFDQRAHVPTGNVGSLALAGNRIYALIDATLHEQQPGQSSFEPRTGVNEYALDIRSMSGALFVAYLDQIIRLDHGTRTTVYKNNRRDILSLEPSRLKKNHLLFSELRDVKILAPDGKVETLAQELPDIARTFAEDDDGRLWLGTLSRGILVVETDGTVTRNPIPTTNGAIAITGSATALATAQGDILLLTNNGGWIKPHGAMAFHPIENFPRRETRTTSPTRDRSDLWVVVSRTPTQAATIGKIVVEGNRAIWRPHAVDGMSSIGSPRGILAERVADQETVLWIGGSRGILRNGVGAAPSAPSPRAPLVQVLAVSKENSIASPVTGALPYDTEAIEFRFAAPQFAVRPTLRLESRIPGVDSEWVPAGADSRRELTAVRDGRYSIEVRAVADTGAVSAVTTGTFEVLPPWWRTWPAAAGVLLVLAPAIYSCYRLRVRSLRRRNTELETKVRQRTAELEEANAAKTQFVAHMSHDIRNPLNGIVGLALALEDTHLEPRQREIVSTLRECTSYLSTLVDDVLDFASIEAGRIELRPAGFSPAELLRSVVATLRADTTVSGATIRVEIDPDLPANIIGDPGRIQQILVNFVSNALKYAGGEIRLTVGLPSQAPDEIQFTVHDHGPGIRIEDHGNLFKKFSRLARSSDGEEIQGRGLGLAACRLLADRMGGSVGVESAVGTGSRFFLRLPLTVTTAPIAPPDLAHALPNTTVLLVEDTDYNAWAATAVLARLGLTCERARNGAEALALFAERRFNIILLDRNLPDMDGTEVAQKIRELETEGQGALILAVTAYCTAEDRQVCLDAGMDAFVGKPLTPEKLRKLFVAAGRRKLAAATVPVPPPTTAFPANLDLALLNYLSDGSPESMSTEIQRFIAALREGNARLNAAALAGDYASLSACAHQLLGQAKTIGGSALAEAARRLEAAARAADQLACAEWLGRVQREVEAVTESMSHRQPALHPV